MYLRVQGLYEYVRPAWEERPRPKNFTLDVKKFGAMVQQRPTITNHESVNVNVDGVNMPG